MSRFLQFYKNKNILVTGGTGLYGTALVEKLLRGFPELGNIYMVVRPKKGLTLAQRKEKFIKNMVFDRLRTEKLDNCFSKLIWIEGDLEKSQMGLKQENINELQANINVVFHCASPTSFLISLKSTVLSILKATKDVLDIATEMKNLDSFIYVSSIFCQATTRNYHIAEHMYPHPMKSNDLIKFVQEELEGKTHSELQEIEKEVIGDWYNTYFYTKSATENLCQEYESKFPLSVYRGPAVAPAIHEPRPYWIGTANAFYRYLMEAHRGYVLDREISSVRTDRNPCAVPIDYIANSMIALGYFTALNSNKVKFYNYSNGKNPCSTRQAWDWYISSIDSYTSELVPQRKQLLQRMKTETIEPGSYLQRMQDEFDFFVKLSYSVRHYLKGDLFCTYENKHFDQLWDEVMTKEEKAFLPFDVRQIEWKGYYQRMYKNAHGCKNLDFNV